MPIKIVVPQLGESVAEGTVSKWLKAVGDRVRKEEPLVEIQTDKINVEIPSPAEGVLEKIVVPEGTTVLVGTEIAVLSGAGEAVPAGRAAAPAAAAAAASARAPAGVPTGEARSPEPAGGRTAVEQGNGGGDGQEPRTLSPAVRKIMRDENVSPHEVAAIRGSGVGGRVTRDDLLDYLRGRAVRPASAGPAAPAAVPAAQAPAAAPPPAF